MGYNVPEDSTAIIHQKILYERKIYAKKVYASPKYIRTWIDESIFNYNRPFYSCVFRKLRVFIVLLEG